MWNKLIRSMADFPSAVLSGVDEDGFPFSLRCKPQPDHDQKVLRLHCPAGAPIQPGPAAVLCHSHDEQLWNLKSFLVQGILEQEGEFWVFHPQRFIPGEGLGGKLSLITALFHARGKTRRYLARRGLRRPEVPWEAINELRDQAKKDTLS